MDAECTQITIDSNGVTSNYTPTTTNPGSGRTTEGCASNPGGQSANLQLWLKAGSAVLEGASDPAEDGDAVTAWLDATDNNRDFDGAVTTNPTYVTNSINFNPAIDFDGVDDELNDDDGEDYTNGEDETTFYVVVEADVLGDRHIFSGEIATNTNGDGQFGLRYDLSGAQTGGTNLIKGTRSSERTESESNHMYTRAHLIQMSGVTGDSVLHFRSNGDSIVGVIDLGDYDDTLSVVSGNELLKIGNGTKLGWDGRIAEFLYYNDYQSITAIEKIETYLAIKYGITILHDYILSDGTIVWDSSAYSTYHNDVAGINRDDIGNQSQLKSRAETDEGLVTMALIDQGGSFASPDDFDADTEALVWGNDGGSKTASETTDVPSGQITERIVRVWRIKETGTVGTVAIQIDISMLSGLNSSLGNIGLLVDNNTTFSDATVYGPTDTTGGVVTYEYDFADGEYFTIGSNTTPIPLPVELISFDATPKGDYVKLDWITATEINNDYFTVRRSEDGKNWEEISTVNGAGNSNSIITYGDYDYSPLKGTSYYQLKQTDYDGKYAFSNIVPVTFETDKPKVLVYPNPASNQLIIEGDITEITHFKIYNSLGQLISFDISEVEKNTTHVKLNISSLTNGVYLIRTLNTSQKILKK